MAWKYSQQEDLEKVYTAIAKEILQGKPKEKCVSFLKKQGCPVEYAGPFVQRIVDDIEDFRKTPGYVQYKKRNAMQGLVMGMVWIMLAFLARVAIVKSDLAVNISIVAVIFGFLEVVYSLYKFLTASKPDNTLKIKK